MTRLELAGVWFKYPGLKDYVLKNISLVADKGEVTVILGGNGAGKTTLLMIAAGLIKPNKGKVLIDGDNLLNLLPGIRRVIGIMFQNPDDQLFSPTVYEEIAFVLKQLSCSENEENKVTSIAKRLELPEEVLNKPPYLLSFGIKKMVALASILVYEPEIVILDEPFSNLSPSYVRTVIKVINELKSQDRTIIIASSNTENVYEIGDRYYILSEGQIAYRGGREVLMREELLYNSGLAPPSLIKLFLDAGCADRLINLFNSSIYKNIVNLIKTCCEKIKED